MKSIKKIMTCFLAFAIVLAFASCKKDDAPEPVSKDSTTSTAETASEPATEDEATTESTTESTTETTTEAKKKSTTTTTRRNTTTTTRRNTTTTTTTQAPKPSNSIVGTWIYDEEISLEELMDMSLPGSYPVKLKLRTTLTYTSDGKFTAKSAIINYDAFASQLEKCYIDMAQNDAAHEGRELTAEEIAELKNEAAADMVALKNECTGSRTTTYSIIGCNIFYEDMPTMYYQMFEVKGNTLTLTGSTHDDGLQYPVTFRRA